MQENLLRELKTHAVEAAAANPAVGNGAGGGGKSSNMRGSLRR